jgi:hypothetical protein
MALAQDIYEVSVSNSLNVRIQPNAESKKIGTLANGTLVEVISINDKWANIVYANTNAYVVSKYLKLKYSIPQEKVSVDTISLDNDTIVETSDTIIIQDTIVVQDTIAKRSKRNLFLYRTQNQQKNIFWEQWSIDFLPSFFVGISNFVCYELTPVPLCSYGFDAGVQLKYSKYSPHNYIAESSIGYAMKGSGVFPIHYFTFRLLPIGYQYNLKKDITLTALTGMVLNAGGGYAEAFNEATLSKRIYIYANPVDIGLQIKVLAEYKKWGFGISYDQGFMSVRYNSPYLLNYGIYLHGTYRINLK